MTLAGTWRQVLTEDPMHARPILSELLKARVIFTPMPHAKHRWIAKGEGLLMGLFQKVLFPSVWRPQRDKGLCIGQPVLDLEGPVAA